MTSCIDWWFFW